jgi:hypothetical protein
MMHRMMMAAVVIGVVSNGAAFAQTPSGDNSQTCKAIHADLVEDRTTEGCKPDQAFCFVGAVDGNHGLRGTTNFKGDSSVPTGPATSPNFRIYSGPFEYTTPTGTLLMRSTGVTQPFPGLPDSGAVTEYQQVQEGTGEFQGVTGYLFVSGFNRDNHIVTFIHGQLCWPVAPPQ